MDGDPGRVTVDRDSASPAHGGGPARPVTGGIGHLALVRLAAWTAANPARISA